MAVSERERLVRVLRGRERALLSVGFHQSVLVSMGLLREEDRHPLTWRPPRYVGWHVEREGESDDCTRVRLTGLATKGEGE